MEDALRHARRWIGHRPESSRILALVRAAYRLAFLALQFYWLVVRPTERSSQLVVVAGGEVLLVRHSYRERSTWTIPGGRVKGGEDFRATATREAAEELCLHVPALDELLTYRATRNRKHDEIGVLVTELPSKPGLVLDRVELLEARWWRRDDLPASLSEEAKRALGELARTR